MLTRDTIQIRLPNRVIDHADERAAFFFLSDISSVGAAASYDRRAASPQNPLDRFVEADIHAIDKTMMARTGYAHWAQFTGSSSSLGCLQALDASWDLLSMGDEAWEAAQCETRILAALTFHMGPYRTISITTKLLHLKRVGVPEVGLARELRRCVRDQQ